MRVRKPFFCICVLAVLALFTVSNILVSYAWQPVQSVKNYGGHFMQVQCHIYNYSNASGSYLVVIDG